MGATGPRSIALATLLGFLSSSCSFAALATTRALFRKGAGFMPSLAFLLASTNLVIELGVVITVFLTWEFVVGEYAGGLLLILVTWGLVSLWRPRKWIAARSEAADGGDTGSSEEARRPLGVRLRSASAWRSVARNYFMEWSMVVKDVTIGFAAAGAIAVFVPSSFFRALFPGGSASDGTQAFVGVLSDAAIGPAAAFCTFIGSMGNVPLAGLLYHSGVSFAGVLAFLFSDLIVFPVLRIQVGYYGWRLALYIASVFLVALVSVSVALHYAFDLLDLLPSPGAVRFDERGPEFAFGHTFYLNLAFLAVTACFWWLRRSDPHGQDQAPEDQGTSSSVFDRVLVGFAWLAGTWVVIGAAGSCFLGE